MKDYDFDNDNYVLTYLILDYKEETDPVRN